MGGMRGRIEMIARIEQLTAGMIATDIVGSVKVSLSDGQNVVWGN